LLENSAYSSATLLASITICLVSQKQSIYHLDTYFSVLVGITNIDVSNNIISCHITFKAVSEFTTVLRREKMWYSQGKANPMYSRLRAAPLVLGR
jgi:arginine deiminase